MKARAAVFGVVLAVVGSSAFAVDPSTDPEAALQALEQAFQPSAIRPRSANSTPVQERDPCFLNHLLWDARAALPRMDGSQRARLSRIDALPAFWVRNAEEHASGLAAAQHTPLHPKLAQHVAGSRCVVHYTFGTTDPDSLAPTKAGAAALAKKYALALDRAINRTLMAFPVPTNAAGTKTVHLYLRKLSADPNIPANSLAVAPADTLRPNPHGLQPTYFAHLEARTDLFATRSIDAVMSILLHEYLHVITFAHSAQSGHSWFFEGIAVWGQRFFIRDEPSLAGFLTTTDSYANSPQRAIFDAPYATSRPYSAAILIFGLDDLKGLPTVRAWLRESHTTADPMTALSRAIPNFGGYYRRYLVRLAAKNIAPLHAREIPTVPTFPVSQLGYAYADSLPLTGSRFYNLNAPAVAPNASLFVTVDVQGTPFRQAILARNSGAGLQVYGTAIAGTPVELPNYSPATPSMLVLTAPDALQEDATLLSFQGTVLSPVIRLGHVDYSSTMKVRTQSPIRVAYDLLGLPPSAGAFPALFHTIDRLGNLTEVVEGEFPLTPGIGGTIDTYFNGRGTGTFSFALQVIVPAPSFGSANSPSSSVSETLTITVTR